MKKAVKKIGITFLVLTFWVIIWYIIAIRVNQELLVATPLAVAKVLWRLVGDIDFWKSVGLSLLRVCEGFIGGVAVGTLAAIASFLSKGVNHLIRPLLTVIKATPVASFIVLALVWINTDRVPVFICFLMVTPIIWANVLQGLNSASDEMKEVCRVFGFSRIKTVRHLYIPSVKPYFIAALNSAIGLAWKAGIAAEVLCRPEFSVGSAIWRAKITLETADVFAWTAVVIILSLVLEELIAALLKKGGKAL